MATIRLPPDFNDFLQLLNSEKIDYLALAYLNRHNMLDCSARFDVIAITWPAGQRKPTIQHIKNAFEAVGQGQMFS